jgi:hypothetical protein
MMQGHGGDAHVPGVFDKVEEIVTRGLGMSQEELGDGAGKAWQQFAVGPASLAVVGCLDGLLGREPLLLRGGGSAEADEAGDVGDLEAGVAVQQEMAEQTPGIIIVATALAKGPSELQQAALLGGQTLRSNPGLGKPLGKSLVGSKHEISSLAPCQGRL